MTSKRIVETARRGVVIGLESSLPKGHTGIINDVSNRVFSDRRFALFASLLDVSTKGLPPGLLLSLSATVCFGFVTIPVRRGPEHALPAAAVVVLQRCHPRCSRLRAVDAAVAQSKVASCIHVEAIAATIV